MTEAANMKAPDTALIVAGPTCSGKSALALHLAGLIGGTVINADSMQVYRDLRLLTARPTPLEEARVPHRLYGVRDAARPGSVAWWRAEALKELARCAAEGRVPVFCGGSGMYLRAMTEGLVEVPDPGEAARLEARQLLATLGAPGLHARLAQVDGETARRLQPGDSQRVARAWEVWRGTGRGLTSWHTEKGLPPAPCRFVSIRLDPPRPLLREAIRARFRDMVHHGALDEVSALLSRGLSPDLPAMRAHGVPELAAVLQGRMKLEDAIEAAVLATGRYTRRQATWFRHHALGRPEDSFVIPHRFDGGFDGGLLEQDDKGRQDERTAAFAEGVKNLVSRLQPAPAVIGALHQ
ncbi:tRNA (adenosine(37)-N6)-dimethylallyltransferase MiaA [Oecophyllibacter saccharovorans]|uniref:tRNA dimethylallyltransferase n=1 Tax=Oecophyllibacter saccharovorans TaxID=2558360 RepID=A0A506UKZ1_9PROT|nr:tRNA (adenosine(37)-N6)-dimethylallyltransferase MiaA [Oecophyllibacter saccharovorans]TPW34009.1 tRNA (adenosine(37)-N6)-dimethylallyltransferase MiaA [Oecophyllibacter saccharovorans]